MCNHKAESSVTMDMLLQIIEDMHPYSVAGIASLLNVPAERADMFLQFLAKYSIVTYDANRKTVIVCTDFVALR